MSKDPFALLQTLTGFLQQGFFLLSSSIRHLPLLYPSYSLFPLEKYRTCVS